MTSRRIPSCFTGTVKNRPAFSRALQDCKDRDIDILLTHQLDRFFRNLQLQLETLGQLGNWGVGYLSVTEQIDYSTPQGMLFLSMLGAFNESYVANLSRETKKGKKGRAKKGLNNASQPAYGYTREEDSEIDVINPEEAEIVRFVFEEYSTGKYSDHKLAILLNQKGIPPTGRATSGKWTREGVRYVTNNPFYIGMVQYGDDLFPGQHEPIIDKKLWADVQKIRNDRTTHHGGKPTNRIYLLSRIARCEHCGTFIVSQTNVRSRTARRSGKTTTYTTAYYYCPAVRRQITCPTESNMATASVFDKQVAQLGSSTVATGLEGKAGSEAPGQGEGQGSTQAQAQELASANGQAKGPVRGRRLYQGGVPGAQAAN